MVKLQDCGTIISGATPKTKVDRYWNGQINWFTPKDLSKLSYKIVGESPQKITEEGYKSCSASMLPIGSLLFTSRAPIGHLAITTEVCCTNQGFKSIIPHKDVVDVNYLYYAMRCFTPQLQDLGTGATFKELNKSRISEFQIPLPPLPTQTRIARALDLADRHRRLLREELAAYDELGESLFLEMFGDPVRNPQKTDFVKLGELGLWKSGGTPSRGNSKYFTGSIPWLTSGELNQVYTTKSNESITEEALSNSSARIAETGSLFLGMYDTAALKSTISTLPVSCNQAIAFTKLNVDLVDTLYVYYALQIGKEEFKKLQRGVRQKNLNLSMVKNIKIPLPPLTLQKEFANRIKKINLLKAKTQTTLKEADDLFNVLLQRAFRGELFPEATAAGE
jgi:type I restriction enzyme S subunit